tara:strand:- start:197 stop:853 length:657 start_codon:yes stop_codon:yes gene_type:complete
MKKRKNIITVAIDSPAAAGAGSQAKLISKHYNLFYLDTGKIYRFIGLLRLNNPSNFTYKLIKKKINKLKFKDLKKKELLSDEVANSASFIAKNNKIRKIVRNFQKQCAYNPPIKYKGSVLDGRDIGSLIVKDAMFKFYITANINTRATRRYKEYRKLKKKIKYNQVLSSLKKRDFSDKNRKYGRLKKTADSILLNTSKDSIKSCFKKIKAIMDRKLNN